MRRGTIADLMGGIGAAVRSAADLTLRGYGCGVQPPTVHILMEDLTPAAYAAYIISRPFYRGSDAAVAIAELGLLPSVLRATHLAIIWEHTDIHGALDEPGEVSDTALAVLEASMVGHTLWWHPFWLHADTWDQDRVLTVSPQWSALTQYPTAPLPSPIEQLLDIWRQWRTGDLDQTAISLQQVGYRIVWAER